MNVLKNKKKLQTQKNNFHINIEKYHKTNTKCKQKKN